MSTSDNFVSMLSIKERIEEIDIKQVIALEKLLEDRRKEIEDDIHYAMNLEIRSDDEEYRQSVISTDWIYERSDLQMHSDRKHRLPVFRIIFKLPKWDTPRAYFWSKKGTFLFRTLLD